MDLADARTFLEDHHRAVLVTHRADGRPQTSPIVCALDGEGRVMISTREPAVKVRNLRRDPRCSLCVLPDGFFGDWIQVDGEAEIVPLPEAMPLLEAVYRSVAGDHPDWDEFRADMERQRRVILRITVTAAGPDISG
jgi:PPOX class probable F420-dependent enzyme